MPPLPRRIARFAYFPPSRWSWSALERAGLQSIVPRFFLPNSPRQPRRYWEVFAPGIAQLRVKRNSTVRRPRWDLGVSWMEAARESARRGLLPRNACYLAKTR